MPKQSTVKTDLGDVLQTVYIEVASVNVTDLRSLLECLTAFPYRGERRFRVSIDICFEPASRESQGLQESQSWWLGTSSD